MKKILTVIVLFIFGIFFTIDAGNNKGKWITAAADSADRANTWIAYCKDFTIDKVPVKVEVDIAADSKYWLWINGRLAVFEGGLKRGPNPRDTYYDKVNITAFLKEGKNRIAVLLWFFGKDGFSHKNSGKSGLFFESVVGNTVLASDETWFSRIHPAFGTAEGVLPNFRLSESNILFDARKNILGWQQADYDLIANGFVFSLERGNRGDAPWNELVLRPIPQWKDFGVKPFKKIVRTRSVTGRDTLTAFLPYNMQMTPVLDIENAVGGERIEIWTDHTYAAGDVNLRATYIACPGRQKYESPGWLNGHKVFFVVPASLKINSLAFRETGYDTDMIGRFSCDDDFYTRFWEKARRTLYVNMRDTYFDCPDRERAQWWGDEVILMGESFYTCSSSVHRLMRKGMLELVGWQKKDGTLFSPIPAGNYDSELPGQMLASIGHYGFWTYYLNTGDLQTIADVYPAVKRYLGLWKLDESGLTAFRAGGWTWGDWGDNRDIRLILAGWHYLALKGAAEMALILGKPEDARCYGQGMKMIKTAYNACWNGTSYRHPTYTDKTDDRVQALAVVSGIADTSKYSAITEFLKHNFHASPYMEKYVMEALFKMGAGEYAMQRTRKRYGPMVDHPFYTTLFEGWDIGKNGFGGGTVNHAWSGGPLIVIAQYVCGIMPEKPGYKRFRVVPDPVCFNRASISFSTVSGVIVSSFERSGDYFKLNLTVPPGTVADLELPVLFGKSVFINGVKTDVRSKNKKMCQNSNKLILELPGGNYSFVVK